MSDGYLAAGHSTFVAVILVAMMYGCTPEAHRVDWQIDFASTELRERVFAVEATIVDGGCGNGEAIYEAEIAVYEYAPTPPMMPVGRYGFAARARDTDCVWYAGGCRDVTLPDHGTSVTVTLVEIDPEAACSPAACSNGYCDVEPDGDADGDVDSDSDSDVDSNADADADSDGETVDADQRPNCEPECEEWCEVCTDSGCEVASLGNAQVIVDEQTPCFEQESDYFRHVWYGFDGHFYYTWAYPADTRETVGTWWFDVSRTGTYDIEAYVEELDDDIRTYVEDHDVTIDPGEPFIYSRSAVYVVRGGAGESASDPIDQTASSGWIHIGTFPIEEGSGRSVELADNTGEARDLNRMIVFDALRFTLVE